MRATRWIGGGLLIAAIVAAVLLLPEPAVEVETTAVTRGGLAVTVDEEGRTRVRDRYVVAAPISGRLTRVTVREGDRVAAGTPLARVHPAPADPREASVIRARLSAAQARRSEAAALVEQVEAAADQAARDLTRMENLAEGGAVSRDALEQARLAATTARRQLESRRAAVRAADAEVASARAALMGLTPGGDGDAVSVAAPAAGRVLRVLQESARVVQAGTPLVEIGDAAGLEVVVDVLSEDAVPIEPGAPVRIEEWGGDTPLVGAVRLVEPEAFTKISALGVDEQRVNVIVDLANPPASLGAGYRVEARIVTWQGERVLRVPSSALFQQGGSWSVFVVSDGRAVRRQVQIGHRATEAAEVLEGLAEGDRVILYPSAEISDGVRVRWWERG